MHGTGVSTVNAFTAHREWATRPPDERFDSVQALYEAARTRRIGTEERDIETVDFGTQAVAEDVIALRDPSGRPAALTHWSFEQLATIAGAPPKYLRTLPASIASAAINHGLRRQGREQHQLFTDQAAPWTVRAITSPRYARVHHDELASRVLDLMASHPAWQLPLGYIAGVGMPNRSVRRLPGRSRHVLLVDGNRDVGNPPTAPRLACSAASSSGTAIRPPPPSPWMCSRSISCAASHHLGFPSRLRDAAGVTARLHHRREPSESWGSETNVALRRASNEVALTFTRRDTDRNKGDRDEQPPRLVH